MAAVLNCTIQSFWLEPAAAEALEVEVPMPEAERQAAPAWAASPVVAKAPNQFAPMRHATLAREEVTRS